MGKIHLFLLVMLSLCLQQICNAQTEFEIDNPSIELRNNKIYITYRILNSSSSDTYTIRLEVSDASGSIVNARAVSGDIGDRIRGGGGTRTIIWDLTSDNIFINEDLFFQLYARSTTPVRKQEPKTEKPVTDPGGQKGMSRTGIILQSVAFPGLGLTRMKGTPHWLKGVAGYGCIAGSLIVNRMAYQTNLDYQNASTSDEASNLRQKAILQDNISSVLAYTAIGIWVSDIVWTVVASSNENLAVLDKRGITIGTTYNSLAKTPLLAVRIGF